MQSSDFLIHSLHTRHPNMRLMFAYKMPHPSPSPSPPSRRSSSNYANNRCAEYSHALCLAIMLVVPCLRTCPYYSSTRGLRASCRARFVAHATAGLLTCAPPPLSSICRTEHEQQRADSSLYIFHLALECVPSGISVVVFGCVRALDHVHFVRRRRPPAARGASLQHHPAACVCAHRERERISHKVYATESDPHP